MSIEIQKQIKDNSTSVSEFFSDLYKWTEDQTKEERRREIRKTAEKKGLQEAQRLAAATAPKATGTTGKTDETENETLDSIKRDKTPMAQYYNDWDQYDPEAEVDKIENDAFQQQRAERESRQAEKDRILDEMALKPDGDRSRTSKAKPRVKVSVRRSGRKIAPVDLAAPRKEEANRLFSAGRYREALASYSAALDLLEKYEPPGSDKASQTEAGDKAQDGDCTGQESEAIVLKVALLANRGLACLKLEEWRECVVDCSEALRFDPSHHKAVLRRGFALARMKRWGLAAKDLDQALAVDPADKKASAELQMVRRMLAEQAKEARAHAKCVMCDPTRTAAMPTRRLAVKVRRGDSMEGLHAGKPPTVEEVSGSNTAASQAVDIAEGSAVPASNATRTYVPRSVRLRGRQSAARIAPDEANGYPAPGGATGSSSRTSKPTSMSFYQFEAQWARLRSRPRERAALLRKVGAAALPALFRESLDSELVASIAEAISSEFADSVEGAARFALDSLRALSRTQRFELSLHSLTVPERDTLDKVLARLSGHEAECGKDELDTLRKAYEPPPPPRPSSPREQQEVAGPEELDEDDIPEDANSAAVAQQAISTSAVVTSASFSLDGCD